MELNGSNDLKLSLTSYGIAIYMSSPGIHMPGGKSYLQDEDKSNHYTNKDGLTWC